MGEVKRRGFDATGACADPETPLSLRARLLLAFYRWIFKPRFPARIDLPRARALMARLDAWLGGRNVALQQLPVDVEDVPGEWVTGDRAAGRPATRTILYLHGGGFMFRTPHIHARLAARLCRALDAGAFVAQYRLAPEHPLPAAHNDCFAAYRWLLATGHDPARIVVCGDSAGGTLTLAVLQRVREAGLPLPSCAVLFSPGFNFADVMQLGADDTRNDPMIGAGVLELLQRVVLTPVDVRDPRVSPGAGSLHGLPPLLFQAGSTEVLLEQSRQAVQRAREAGTIAEIQIWPQMPHVFQAVHWLPEAREALVCVRDFVERHEGVARAARALGAHREAGVSSTEHASLA